MTRWGAIVLIIILVVILVVRLALFRARAWGRHAAASRR
jgi:hypothetical protein